MSARDSRHRREAAMHQSMKHVITNPKALWQLIKESVTSWSDDYAPSMGAAISYYTVFSIAPLLLIVIAIVGFVFGREAATGQIFDQLRGMIGDEGATAIQGMVRSASDPGKGAVATAVGAVTLLFGASTVFTELQSSLDRIWRAPAVEKKEGVWNLVRTRILSFGMILGIGFLLLVSLVVSAGIAALGSWWGPLFGGFELLLHAVNFVVSIAVVTVLFALIYKFLPRVKIGWHDVWIGAAATALLFTVGKFLIGLYIGKSSVVSGFGAAGSLAVVLIWVYYSAQIFLLGAEFTWVFAHRYGSRQHEQEELQAKAPAGKSPAATTLPGRAAPGSTARPRQAGRGAPQPLAPAARAATDLLDRYPPVGIALAVVLGGVAGLLAKMRGRL